MNIKSFTRGVVVGAALVVFTSLTSWGASLITSDPSLPPDGVYLSPSGVHTMYSGPGLSIVLQDIQHQPLVGTAVRTPVGPDEHETFNSIVEGLVSVNGSPFLPFMLQGLVETLVLNKVGNTTGTFQTEMLSLNLTGTILGNPVAIRESPTLPSLGQTTIADEGGGLFRINSFFDVFTELSIDGGSTWLPSQGATRVELHGVPDAGGTITLLLITMGAIGLCQRCVKKYSC